MLDLGHNALKKWQV